MSLQSIEFIIGTVSLLVAYILSTMLVGRLEAEVATRAGDDTPKEAGFLSWDPLVFLDIPGFLCVMLFGMGWGRQLPFNPHNVTGKHKLFSVFLVYMSQPLFSLLLALFALVVTTFLVGPDALYLAFGGLTQSAQGVPFQVLTRQYPHVSSLILVCVTLLLALIAFNTFNAVWSLINNGFHYVLFVGHERNHDYMRHAEVLTFFGPLLTLILFFGLLRYVILKYLIVLARYISALVGILL